MVLGSELQPARGAGDDAGEIGQAELLHGNRTWALKGSTRQSPAWTAFASPALAPNSAAEAAQMARAVPEVVVKMRFMIGLLCKLNSGRLGRAPGSHLT